MLRYRYNLLYLCPINIYACPVLDGPCAIWSTNVSNCSRMYIYYIIIVVQGYADLVQ